MIFFPLHHLRTSFGWWTKKFPFLWHLWVPDCLQDKVQDKLSKQGRAGSGAISPPHWRSSTEEWGGSGISFNCQLDSSLGRCSGHVPLGEDTEQHPGHTVGTKSLFCPHQTDWRQWLRKSGCLCWCYSCNPEEIKDAYLKFSFLLFYF